MGDMKEYFDAMKAHRKEKNANRMEQVTKRLTTAGIRFKVLCDREIIIAKHITFYPAKNWYQNRQNKSQGRAGLEKLIKIALQIIKEETCKF